MKPNEQQKTSKEPVDIVEVEKDVENQPTPNDAPNDDCQNNGDSVEPQNLPGVIKPNDLDKPVEVQPVESNEPVKETFLNEFDNGVRNAVSNIYNDTVKNQVTNQDHDDTSEDGDKLVIDEEKNEIDANAQENCDTAFNEQDDDNQFFRSEFVAQRTQHLMIQSVDDGAFIELMREEVVVTTLTDQRTETKKSDFVEPGKRKAQDSQEDEKPTVKRRLSVGTKQPQANLELKPMSKRRYSLGVRGRHLGNFIILSFRSIND